MTRTSPTTDGSSESPAIEAARRDEEGAFERLVGPYRPELHAHCYRLLGSAADAEEALQEALLRAWRGLPAFEGRSTLRSWLYRIATNVCLKRIERRPPLLLPLDHGPPSDPHDAPARPLIERLWVEPYPDEAVGLAGGRASPEARYEQREAVELAFVAALQHLPARQRAVLLLRDVLGFSPAEIAHTLAVTRTSVYSTLQRARSAVEERLPERSQQATLRSLEDGALRGLVERYVEAWEQGDVDAIVAMLTEDAVFAMPPRPTWYRGRDDIGVFLAARPLAGAGRWRMVPLRANAQPAVAFYGRGADGSRWAAHAVHVLSLRSDGAIAQIASFQTPGAFAGFGLAATPAG